VVIAAVLLPLALAAAAGPAGPSPESRALAYLAREVPRWARENRCYSCHNNGDAARALYDAARRSGAAPPAAVADTTRWLARPEGWDRNGGGGPFADERLARVQFASALAAAVTSGAVKDRAPLVEAARRLAGDQEADGSWPVDEGAGAVGSPAAYGRALATLAARDALRAADPARFRAAIGRADRWLSARPLNSVLDAAVALLASAGGSDAPPAASRTRALDRLLAAQSGDGGWGPFADTPTEPFDTALALLALATLDPTPPIRSALRRGRSALIAEQDADGGWPETTRPAGGRSYAQRLSTTGWATLALLATRAPDRER